MGRYLDLADSIGRRGNGGNEINERYEISPTPRRVAILEPGGRTVEVDAPSGWTVADWQAYAERYHGPAGCAVSTVLPLPKPRARVPVNLDEALRAACEGVGGITPEVFRSLLSPEDLVDIGVGAIHRKTLRAYAQSFAEGIRSGRVVVILGRAPSLP